MIRSKELDNILFLSELVLKIRAMENKFWSIIEADLFTDIPYFVKNALTLVVLDTRFYTIGNFKFYL